MLDVHPHVWAPQPLLAVEHSPHVELQHTLPAGQVAPPQFVDGETHWPFWQTWPWAQPELALQLEVLWQTPFTQVSPDGQSEFDRHAPPVPGWKPEKPVAWNVIWFAEVSIAKAEWAIRQRLPSPSRTSTVRSFADCPLASEKGRVITASCPNVVPDGPHTATGPAVCPGDWTIAAVPSSRVIVVSWDSAPGGMTSCAPARSLLSFALTLMVPPALAVTACDLM